MTDAEREKILQKAEPKPIRDHLVIGAILIVAAGFFFSASVPIFGLISGAAAIYQFVVAAIAQGVKEGRKDA